MSPNRVELLAEYRSPNGNRISLFRDADGSHFTSSTKPGDAAMLSVRCRDAEGAREHYDLAAVIGRTFGDFR